MEGGCRMGRKAGKWRYSRSGRTKENPEDPNQKPPRNTKNDRGALGSRNKKQKNRKAEPRKLGRQCRARGTTNKAGAGSTRWPARMVMNEANKNNERKRLRIRQQNICKSLEGQLEALNNFKNRFDIICFQEQHFNFQNQSRALQNWYTIYPTKGDTLHTAGLHVGSLLEGEGKGCLGYSQSTLSIS